MKKYNISLIVFLFFLFGFSYSQDEIDDYEKIQLSENNRSELKSLVGNKTYYSKFFKINGHKTSISINSKALESRIEKGDNAKFNVDELKAFKFSKINQSSVIELSGKYNNDKIKLKITILNSQKYSIGIVNMYNSKTLLEYSGYFNSKNTNSNLLKSSRKYVDPYQNTYEVFDTYKDIKDPFLNLRSKPNKNSNILSKLKDGTRIMVFSGVYGEKGKWVKISVRETNITGFVHRRYIRKI